MYSVSAGSDSCLINTSVYRVPGTKTVDGDSDGVSDLTTGSDFKIMS